MVKFKEVILFGIIGVLNTSIDIGVFALLKYILDIPNSSALILWINLIAIITAMIFSYFANKYITFNHKSDIKSNEIGGFILVNGLGFIVNSIILRFTILFFAGAESIPIISPTLLLDTAILGKILGTGGSMIVTFIGYKFFVFRK